MEKTLFVTDLDGTLLNGKQRINPQSIEIINSLIEKGLLFTYATARSLASASIVTEGLNVRVPVVTFNGTFICEASTGKILSQEMFNEVEIEKIKAVLESYGVSFQVYSLINHVEKVSWFTEKENEGIRRYAEERKGDKRLRPVKDGKELYKGNMFYFSCIGEKEELKPVYDVFSKDERYRCILYQDIYSTDFWCEIMPANATKANAIKKLKENMGCSRVISFGDAVNDIPMFEISDEAYAVENAVEELKALATGVIAGNEDDGVAIWLKENAEGKF